MTCLMTVTMLSGCGSSSNLTASGAGSSGGSTSVAGETTESAGQEAPSQGTSSLVTSSQAENDQIAAEGKTLVLYYSATGNTKKIADMIAADTNADEYEITPSEPYSEEDLNWTQEDSRVNREHEDESLQDIAFDSYEIPDFDAYDTVFVGYPIWWQDASWVMKSFVKHVDFSGKTVIPFCTSSSSGLGDSGKNLESLAGSGTWLTGQRFSGGASAEDVQSWVSSLDL